MTIEFCLPEFSARKTVTWKFQVGEFTNSIYDMILGRYLLTTLVLDLKFNENVTIGGEGPYEGWSVPMDDVRSYDFTSTTDKTVKPKESFINSHVDEWIEPDSEISSTRRMRRIIDTKYEKADLNKVTSEQCQHLNTIERYRLLNL